MQSACEWESRDSPRGDRTTRAVVRPPRALICSLAAASLVLAGCGSAPPAATARPEEVRARITTLLPAGVADRPGWAIDIYAAFDALRLEPSLANICAVLAVTEQESTFRTDPTVPGLGRIAREEIDRRAERAGVPPLLVQAALQLRSPDSRTWSERISAARSEKELSDLFEDFISQVPLGQRFLAGYNPAHYDQPIYRFADFNAGQYASRNAAFQNAVSALTGVALDLDGDLVAPGGDAPRPGSTEAALRSLVPRLNLSDAEVRQALAQEGLPSLEQTRLWAGVFELADEAARRPAPRAMLPRIHLQSPKISRPLTTEWFARRVDERYQRCLTKGG